MDSAQHFNRHLDCQPAVIDARDFSPQLRRRYFWGNLPGLYTLPDNLSGDGDGEAAEGSKDYSAVNDTSSRLTHLAQALMPHAGRRAAQLHVRTLTTNTNSLLQGRTEDCRTKKELTALFPVRLTERNENNSSVGGLIKFISSSIFIQLRLGEIRGKKMRRKKRTWTFCGCRRSSESSVSLATSLMLVIYHGPTDRSYWGTLGPSQSWRTSLHL